MAFELKPLNEKFSQTPNGGNSMRILDWFLETQPDYDGRIRNEPIRTNRSKRDEKEVITVEPEVVSNDPPYRPPIIFENGLM